MCATSRDNGIRETAKIEEERNIDKWIVVAVLLVMKTQLLILGSLILQVRTRGSSLFFAWGHVRFGNNSETSLELCFLRYEEYCPYLVLQKFQQSLWYFERAFYVPFLYSCDQNAPTLGCGFFNNELICASSIYQIDSDPVHKDIVVSTIFR